MLLFVKINFTPRKYDIYSMNWINQINLQELKVAVAQFGGLIAVVRDEKKFTPVQTSGKPNIFIFNSSGDLKSSIKVCTEYTFH